MYVEHVDVDQFRRFFHRHVSTVTVITSADGGERGGLAATAVNSLSDSPPSLLVCISQRSNTCRLINRSRRFAVNILRDNQSDIASTFARPATGAQEGKRKFLPADAWNDHDGVPVLRSALASAVCIVATSTECSTHKVLIGSITAVRIAEAGQPLLYGFRKFCSVADGDLAA